MRSMKPNGCIQFNKLTPQTPCDHVKVVTNDLTSADTLIKWDPDQLGDFTHQSV